MTYFNISALREAHDTPGLTHGSDALRKVENLRVPVCSKPYLCGEVLDEEFETTSLLSVPWQNNATFPGAFSQPFNVIVHSIKEISQEGEVHKPKFEIQLAFDENEPSVKHFEAGDSFYVICANTDVDVEFLLARLDLTSKADLKYQVECMDGAKKSMPEYIPKLSSIRYILAYCLDIRRAPSRPVIRALSEYCENPDEQRRMLELCSIDGTKEFSQHVQMSSISLIDFLIHFESCRPPVERLIEILPRLLPRAYTVSSWDIFKENRLRFIVSLLRTNAGNGVVFSRYGLCSGYLKSRLNTDTIKLIAKEPSKFRFPLVAKPEHTLANTSVVMIGPGTGIAPFLAFLERFRELQTSNAEGDQSSDESTVKLSWIRNSFAKKNLKHCVMRKVLTNLVICESRPKEESELKHPKYVYDALKQQPNEFWDFLFSEPQPFIYACGDVKQMSKQLWECFTNELVKRKGITKPEAVELLKRLRTEEYFIEDVWS
ncbi:Methionine synthase reductase [Aphelenchoides bicaudatus]|nr:Methionine synthase reductase [Aphelenchoides bicaudatus]